MTAALAEHGGVSRAGVKVNQVEIAGQAGQGLHTVLIQRSRQVGLVPDLDFSKSFVFDDFVHDLKVRSWPSADTTMGRIPKHSASGAAPVDADNTPLANWVGAVWDASAHRRPTGIIEERDEQNLAAIAPGASSGNEGA